MHNFNPWPFFPAHLEPKAACSFSLQFLLQELLLAFDLSETLHKQIELSLPLSMPIEEIVLKLEQCFLFPLENPLVPKTGFLEKIFFYMETLLQHSSVNDENGGIDQVEEIKKCILEIKAKIKALKKTRDQQEEKGQIFIRLIKNTKKHLEDLFHSLFPFFEEYREDENLLFLLIEQKEKMNQYLGSRALETLLSRLFPQGPATFRAALYNGYERRGFLDFYARNEELIDTVDWEGPCPLSDQKP